MHIRITWQPLKNVLIPNPSETNRIIYSEGGAQASVLFKRSTDNAKCGQDENHSFSLVRKVTEKLRGSSTREASFYCVLQ